MQNFVFLRAIITETAKKSLAPTEGQMVMPKLHYTMTTHSFQEILIVCIYWDLMAIIFQIYFHQVCSQAHHVQMIMRGTTVYCTPDAVVVFP